MGCLRTVFGFTYIIGVIMMGMGVTQIIISFFGYTYESLEGFGDPTEAGITALIIGTVFLVVGKGVDWLLRKFSDWHKTKKKKK